MEFLSLTRRCPSWRNVPNGEERRDTAVFSSQGVLVKSLVFKKASKISTINLKTLIKIFVKVTNNRISTAHYFLTPFIFYCSADSAFIQFYMRVQHKVSFASGKQSTTWWNTKGCYTLSYGQQHLLVDTGQKQFLEQSLRPHGHGVNFQWQLALFDGCSQQYSVKNKLLYIITIIIIIITQMRQRFQISIQIT